MKQQILNLKKKLLIVELPEGASNIRAYNGSIHYDILINTEAPTNLLAKVKNLIGKLTDITEEQFKEWVERFNNGAVRDYREQVLLFDPADDLANFCLTAKESFFSYLEANGVLFFRQPTELLNPYGVNAKWVDPLEVKKEVWSKDRCYIFEII